MFKGIPFLTKELPYIGISLSQIILAIAVLIISWIVSRILLNIFRKRLKKTNLQEIAIDFLERFIAILMNIAVLLVTIAALGISISSVIVGLSAVIGLVLGFGMQDTLTNVGSGIWIVVTRAIDKGEYVEIGDKSGTVQKVGMMAAELLTPDNKFITMPNKLIWNEPIVNYTRMPIRRVGVDVGIAYDSDVGKAFNLALELMKKHKLVLEDPEPAVITSELADSSVNLQLRPWCKTEDYWTVTWEIRKQILAKYNEEGIEIPFPQMDVEIKKK